MLASSTAATFGLHTENMPNLSNCSTSDLTSALSFDAPDKKLSLQVARDSSSSPMPSKHFEKITLSPSVMQKRSRAVAVSFGDTSNAVGQLT